MSMIKPKFTFFQMKIKKIFINASEFSKAGLCICPEALDSVYMRFPFDKLVVSMPHPVMFLISQINKTGIASPCVGMYYALRVNSASNYALQRCFSAIRDYFRINASMSLENAKNYCLSVGSPSSFAFNSSRSKITFIYFYYSRKGKRLFTINSYFLSNRLNIFIDGLSAYACNFRNLSRIQVIAKQADYLLKFPLRNVCTFYISINLFHDNNLAYIYSS